MLELFQIYRPDNLKNAHLLVAKKNVRRKQIELSRTTLFRSRKMEFSS